MAGCYNISHYYGEIVNLSPLNGKDRQKHCRTKSSVVGVH